MKKVLVTGATGLIGKELIEPLKKAGFEIHAITIDENNPDNGVNWIKGNLFNSDEIFKIVSEIKPQYLLNMAWATTGDYLSSDINYKFLNAGINLLEAFKLNGGKRAVFAGTCFEYKFKNEPLKEDGELDFEKTEYTFCKNKLREIAEHFCKKNNISFGYGRIFYVFGNGENKTRLTGALLDKLPKNEEVIIQSGELIKDYMYSKEIARAFVEFLDSNTEGCVNICTGKALSLKDYVLAIANKLGKTEFIKFGEGFNNQPEFIVGDNSRLVKEVGFKYKYTLDDAIDEIIDNLKG